MLEPIDELLAVQDIQFRVARLLIDLNQRAEADGAIIAVPNAGGREFRVWPAVPGDIPFGEVSLPIENSYPCQRAIETGDIVSERDVASLPRERACTFMLAEEFAGYLGGPITLRGDTAPSAVLAIVTYDARDWTEEHHALLRSTAEGVAGILSGGREAGTFTH
ncbi:MAG: hypothetical protein AAGB18_07515 [Pseudomonadota bacterium]